MPPRQMRLYHQITDNPRRRPASQVHIYPRKKQRQYEEGPDYSPRTAAIITHPPEWTNRPSPKPVLPVPILPVHPANVVFQKLFGTRVYYHTSQSGTHDICKAPII